MDRAGIRVGQSRPQSPENHHIIAATPQQQGNNQYERFGTNPGFRTLGGQLEAPAIGR